LRTQALAQADSQFSGTVLDSANEQINKEFDALKGQYGDGKGNISLTDATQIKSYLQGQTNYDATRPTNVTATNKIMASVTRQAVEDTAETNGLPGVAEINKIIAQHEEALKFLNRINGQTIKGGKIGIHVKEGIGAAAGYAAGSAVGGAFGSPTIGAAVGTMAGGAAGNLFSKFLQKFSTGGTISAAAIGRMAAQDPEVVQKFLDYLGPDAFDATNKVAPILEPVQKGAASRVQSALSKTPGQAILNAMKAGYTPQEIEAHLNASQ